jgi:hypothetical protein
VIAWRAERRLLRRILRAVQEGRSPGFADLREALQLCADVRDMPNYGNCEPLERLCMRLETLLPEAVALYCAQESSHLELKR